MGAEFDGSESVVEAQRALVAAHDVEVQAAGARGGDTPRHRTHQHVALKVVRSELADDPQFRVRFAREVHAARAVAGPYTARLVDADTEASPQWIATEYVPGPTLAEHVEAHGPMPEDQVRLLGLGLAEAVRAIHSVGLIHRDLKPSNVILASGGPRVIDFGISQAVDATSLTQTGVHVGSLAWMSPEQVTGEVLSPATDMFSLGLLLAFAARGQHPYGDGRPEAVAFRMVNQYPDLEQLPAPLQVVCGRLLAKAPDDRPSPESLVSGLTGGATQIHDITRVMGTRWDAPVIGSPAALPPIPDATHVVARPSRRRRRGVLVAVAGTLAAATAIAVALGVVPLPIGSQPGDASAEAPATPPTDAGSTDASGESATAGGPVGEATPNEDASRSPARYPLLVETTLTVRSGPYLDAEAIGQLDAGDTVLVECVATGDPVQESDTIVNNQWNRISEPTEGWVSDAYVDTGRSPAPQAECGDIPTRQAAAPPTSALSGDAIWPDLAKSVDYASSFANGADPAGASSPGFPTQVEGYELAYQETLDPSRAFWQQPNPAWGFPATMNGCAQQRFYVRWRPLDEDAQIQATWTHSGTGVMERR